jgi:hypothetical protein
MFQVQGVCTTKTRAMFLVSFKLEFAGGHGWKLRILGLKKMDIELDAIDFYYFEMKRKNPYACVELDAYYYFEMQSDVENYSIAKTVGTLVTTFICICICICSPCLITTCFFENLLYMGKEREYKITSLLTNYLFLVTNYFVFFVDFLHKTVMHRQCSPVSCF